MFKIIFILFIFCSVGVAFAETSQWTFKFITTFKLNLTATLPKLDLCDIQNKLIDAINGFSAEGQKSSKKVLLDVQHELSNVIQKQYSAIKAQNGATLAKLMVAEGAKLSAFYKSIGFNNETAFSGAQVDLCQIQTDMNDSFKKMQQASQLIITRTANYYFNQAKYDLNNIANVIIKKDKEIILNLYNTEIQSQLMIVANVLESILNR
jgi:hypothetical protein